MESSMRLFLASSIVIAVAVGGTASGQPVSGVPRSTATFRSGVELVTVSAVVRDGKGRVVSDLQQSDFELLDDGEPRAIASFRAEPAPVSVALLFDVSGSMHVAAKIEKARVAARYVLALLQPGRDELAVYSFDSGLQQRQPFALYQQDAALERSLVGLAPWGLTSLHDAIAATAHELAARPNAHRAVIVLTDGVDNNSRLSAPEVSGVASSIDVPVYIMAVVSPLDHVGTNTAVNSGRPVPVGDLADLARWTGGECFVTSLPLQTSQAAERIVEELRHQYLIAFEPAGRPGWRPLEVRTRGRRLVVRARSGYIAGSTKNGSSDSNSR
jgi:Ca-activated chloride channel family protein